MAIDLREKSNYFFLIKNGKVYDEHKRNVKILKDYEDSTKYSILFNDKVIVPGGIVWDKVTLDGSPFDSQEEFETWVYENTGFKTASGGSGAATSYNDLTDKATVDLPVINTPLANALADKEDKVNKQTDLTSTDAEHYPNVPAVKAGINDAVTTANNYTDAQIAGLPDIFHKKISLTASQFKNINTTPIDLIDAPGAGKIIGNVGGLFKLNFGTIPFNFPNGLLLLKNEGAMVGKCYIAHENANATVSGVFDLLPPQIGGPGISAIPNTKLQLTQNSNASTGDSTVDIYLTYEIVTL